MNNRIVNYQKFVSELELDSGDSPEFSGGDSPRSAASADAKIASTPSSKKRRAIQKRVVSVAMKDVEGFRLKGDQISAPPSDSWAWRKYGQKPIKGSPYPRGYYRCSSSKGCPARKQVERSRLDSQMLVVTYYCEHNHPWPPSRNHHRSTKVATPVSEEEEEEEEDEHQQQDEELEDESKKTTTITINPPPHEIMIPDYRFSNLGEGTFIQASEFGWLTEFESSINCSMHESTILSEDIEMATIFQMPEEDERLFADLGELPECSAVFRRGLPEQRPRVPSMATTG